MTPESKALLQTIADALKVDGRSLIENAKLNSDPYYRMIDATTAVVLARLAEVLKGVADKAE